MKSYKIKRIICGLQNIFKPSAVTSSMELKIINQPGDAFVPSLHEEQQSRRQRFAAYYFSAPSLTVGVLSGE